MVKNNLIRILKIFLFTFIIFGVLNAGICEAEIKDPFDDPDQWAPKIEDDTTFTKTAGKILGVINVIGLVIGVLVAAGLGIKFMLGSVEEKATYKKDFMPYLIGAFMLVLATTLPNIIYKLTTSALEMQIS